MDVGSALKHVLTVLLVFVSLYESFYAQTLTVINPPTETRTPEVIREIKFLTADNTLLEIVRAHDLATGFNLPDEAAAVVRLRGMMDLIEDPAGNAFEISVLSDDLNLAETLTNAVADASAGHRADFREADGPLTKEVVAAELKQLETFVEASRTRMMRVMHDFSIIDPSIMREQVREDSPSHAELPLEFFSAKRSYEQQLSVLNYTREKYRGQSIRQVPEEPRSAPQGISPLKTTKLNLLANLPAATAPPLAVQPPQSPWAGYFWLAGGIIILIFVLLLIKWLYANRRKC